MAGIKEIFETEFLKLVEDLKANHILMGMKASGDWLESVEVVATEQSAKILANDYTWYLVNGRKGGKFPNVDAMRKWVIDKGIVSNTAKQTKINSVAYLISRKIAERGTNYYQQGGTDLLDAVITPERMQSIIDLVGEQMTMTLVTKIENQFNTIFAEQI